MKPILSFLIFISFYFTGDNKINLLCQKWRRIGIKSFGKEFKTVNKLDEIIVFKNNGTFEKELYGNLHFKGIWLFSHDSTKLAMTLTEMNGTTMTNNHSLNTDYATDSIIKLTKDTLIDGHLGYFGVEKIYGHDDIYYISEK
ncbi:MAG TPA: hypothetical protein VHZ50_17510 [Puia sp.]|jgi:hypothetical protein|nr:hypothetical protein [Puia sp.]